MYPYDYNYPFDPYSGAYQQRQPQPPQNMQNNSQPAHVNNSPELVYVQTRQQVEQVQLQPGFRKIIMVQNEPVIAMRVADNMGLVTTDYYNLVKIEPVAPAIAPETNVKYVTEEQLENRLTALVDALQKASQPSRDNSNKNNNNNKGENH